ncbi:hypothetical protein IMG5_185440 [Ichthyophthirius multifiliis]|uniref:Transmembrane protein n=1 Tax=Ichthyophthirius multifiliis TaxID=5932 RepID=G0R3H2_ICHMU|nr:hypothetical protein IMG5_185440 [Ichthyophthirius multifiliis]EGR27961.1 hypothetical protein IMG5_185440 [Ichthyophthirius multifiliis]|eukprot:XP_004027306.1 hypothetical protein IMG5_185440 [Ichthyophthirius multifiliis]
MLYKHNLNSQFIHILIYILQNNFVFLQFTFINIIINTYIYNFLKLILIILNQVKPNKNEKPFNQHRKLQLLYCINCIQQQNELQKFLKNLFIFTFFTIKALYQFSQISCLQQSQHNQVKHFGQLKIVFYLFKDFQTHYSSYSSYIGLKNYSSLLIYFIISLYLLFSTSFSTSSSSSQLELSKTTFLKSFYYSFISLFKQKDLNRKDLHLVQDVKLKIKILKSNYLYLPFFIYNKTKQKNRKQKIMDILHKIILKHQDLDNTILMIFKIADNFIILLDKSYQQRMNKLIPGPGTYEVKGLNKFGNYFVSKFQGSKTSVISPPLKSRYDQYHINKLNEIPGPGQYEQYIKQQGHQFAQKFKSTFGGKFSNEQRMFTIGSKFIVPGPGSYNIRKNIILKQDKKVK